MRGTISWPRGWLCASLLDPGDCVCVCLSPGRPLLPRVLRGSILSAQLRTGKSLPSLQGPSDYRSNSGPGEPRVRGCKPPGPGEPTALALAQPRPEALLMERASGSRWRGTGN